MARSDGLSSADPEARPVGTFIPFSRQRVLDMLVDEAATRRTDGENTFSEDDLERLRVLHRLLNAFFHFEFHDLLERMKEHYAPFDPELALTTETETNRDSLPVPSLAPISSAHALAEDLHWVLSRGNYVALDRSDVEAALDEAALIDVAAEIDFDAYEDIVLYYRGERERTLTKKKWLGLRKVDIQVSTYDRVCVFVRYKPKDDLSPKLLKRPNVPPGAIILKLFRNVPKADLEMLLPNLKVRMRRRDTLFLGVPALFGGIPVVIKIMPALFAIPVLLGVARGRVDYAAIAAGVTGFAAMGAYVFQRWESFKRKKLEFLQQLSENLYFRNLDNNEGVLTRLVDEAEEEECKEALIAYSFLRWEGPLDQESLDRKIERWFETRHATVVDFEVDDALGKLERLGLVEKHGEQLAAAPLHQAIEKLDEKWAAILAFSKAAAAPPATGRGGS